MVPTTHHSAVHSVWLRGHTLQHCSDHQVIRRSKGRQVGWKDGYLSFSSPSYFFQKNLNEQTCEAGPAILLKWIQWHVVQTTVTGYDMYANTWVRNSAFLYGNLYLISSIFFFFFFFFFNNYIINSVLTSCHSSGGGCCQVSLLSACYSVYMFTLRQRWCGAKKRTGTQEASVHCR